MATYAYKAVTMDGRRQRGRMAAANLTDLESRLKPLGLALIHGVPVRTEAVIGRSIPRRELINFCFHLEQLMLAGVPLIESLGDLRDSTSDLRFREILAGMVESIGGGRTLSEAMAEHPRAFDDVTISLIRAGEAGGRLTETLAELLESLKWQDELAAHTRRLLAYPAFMLIVMLALVVFLMVYLVPRMVGFLGNLGHAPPVTTRALISVSGFLLAYWHVTILSLAAGGIALGAAVRADAGVRRTFDAAKLAMPVLGPILRKLVLARFARTFALLYAAGIPVLDALRTTEDVVGNTVVRAGLRDAGLMISEGVGVAAAFQQVSLFPPLVIRMLRVGEGTGGLDSAMRNAAYFFSRDARETVERAQALIEPTMTVIIGGLLGWIMLSVLGPIYDAIAAMKT